MNIIEHVSPVRRPGVWMSVGAIVAVVALAVVGWVVLRSPIRPVEASELPAFASCQELRSSLNAAIESNKSTSRWEDDFAFGLAERSVTTLSNDNSVGSAPEYSTTNTQVQGVDEADIVKSDGNFLYTLSDQQLVITRAYPVSQAAVVSRTDRSEISATQMFLLEDRVLIIGNRWIYPEGAADGENINPKLLDEMSSYPVRIGGSQFTVAELWDVSDHARPTLVRTTEVEGSFVSARMIDGNVYFVTTKYVSALPEDDDRMVPMYRDTFGAAFDAEQTSVQPLLPCDQVTYFQPVDYSTFINVASISLTDDNAEIQKQVTVGSGENIFASTENLYVSQTVYEETVADTIEPAINTWIGGKAQTTVHKFALRNGAIIYIGNGTVDGTVLNQFSMDEHEGVFRIATTQGTVTRDGTSTSANHVYLLNEQMERIGSLENLARGEKIYSVRFMGDRGYVVTFKKVDPLFVLDLSDPTKPSVVGELKIPGYSDYLHPYDENHLIGIGKDAVDAKEGDFAWYQGLKLAVFDVTDPKNPIQLHQEIIGDRGTDSEVLRDHKALLFDRKRNLFVIPVSLVELEDEVKTQSPSGSSSSSAVGPPTAYGTNIFNGAYVYRLTLEKGFELRGRISHKLDSTTPVPEEKLSYSLYGETIKRSLFIDDALYTLSDSLLKINDLEDLSELKTIELLAPSS